MSQSRFRFALFYFYNKNASGIITEEYKKEAEKQVTKKPDLESEVGWVEVRFPQRKGSSISLSAKILLLGNNYKEMVEKKTVW